MLAPALIWACQMKPVVEGSQEHHTHRHDVVRHDPHSTGIEIRMGLQ